MSTSTSGILERQNIREDSDLIDITANPTKRLNYHCWSRQEPCIAYKTFNRL